jgi:hypothetical protein
VTNGNRTSREIDKGIAEDILKTGEDRKDPAKHE